MALEGDATSTAGSVTEPVESSTAGGGQGNDPAKTASSVQGTDPAKKTGWDAERAGLVKDLQGERKHRQALENQFRDLQAKFSAAEDRLKRFAGVEVRSPDEIESDAIKAKLEELYPWLGKLNEQQVEKLLGLSDTSDQVSEMSEDYWRKVGDRMKGAVCEILAKEFGGDLSDTQRKQIDALYRFKAENDPEFLARHAREDKGLAQEFAKEVLDTWFEPARRKVTRTAVEGAPRRVPVGKDRSVVTSGEKKIDVTDVKAVEDALVEGFRSRGGTFNRER